MVDDLRFEWDNRKAAANLRKHGVSFEEAQTVFYDERALFQEDAEHSQDEDRFLILGLSITTRVLVVCHCYRESDEVIRVISARKADAEERAKYESRNKP